MSSIEVEILSNGINCPVVQLPYRKFPGILIQGDSLSILLSMANEVCDLTSKQDSDRLEIAEAATELRDKLADYLSAYERTMQAHSKSLPYWTAMDGSE